MFFNKAFFLRSFILLPVASVMTALPAIAQVNDRDRMGRTLPQVERAAKELGNTDGGSLNRNRSAAPQVERAVPGSLNRNRSATAQKPDIPRGQGSKPRGQSSSFEALRREIPLFQLIRQKSSGVVNAEFKEVQRPPLKGINTDKLDMSKQVTEEEMKKGKWVNQERARVPKLSSLKGNSTFEFYDITTGRTFQMSASMAEMAEFARSMSRMPDQTNPLDRPDRRAVAQDEQMNKAWSNADDSRTRRAIADGYSDTNSIYQRIANYGGCSANVISANSQRLVATTAGHCVFATRNTFNYSTVDPRRNGSASPTWGTWTPVGFGYDGNYRDLDCEEDWSGSKCIHHDIALVVAVPNPGATPPKTMGWGYRSKSWLNARSKYRRGYPGCPDLGSPAGCTNNNLYGDGAFNIGPLDHPVSGGWNREMLVSDDASPGDSGSGAYYYSGGYPYVFAVASAQKSCVTTCTGTHVNYLRRITPVWFDFISDVVF